MYRRIAELRKDKDMSQETMGKILNCSQRVLSDYERGVLDIPTAVLIGLAEYFDVSVDYILGLTDVQKPYPRAKHNRERL